MSDAFQGFDDNEIDGLLVEEPEKSFLTRDYKIYDYAQQEIERVRDRRESDFIPLNEEGTHEKFLTPLYCITAIFATLMIVGPFLVKQGPNRGIIQASILLTAFCMWIFWFTIYFGQMNPLMGPRLENTTVAWIAYKLVRNSYFDYFIILVLPTSSLAQSSIDNNDTERLKSFLRKFKYVSQQLKAKDI